MGTAISHVWQRSFLLRGLRALRAHRDGKKRLLNTIGDFLGCIDQTLGSRLFGVLPSGILIPVSIEVVVHIMRHFDNDLQSIFTISHIAIIPNISSKLTNNLGKHSAPQWRA